MRPKTQQPQDVQITSNNAPEGEAEKCCVRPLKPASKARKTSRRAAIPKHENLYWPLRMVG